MFGPPPPPWVAGVVFPHLLKAPGTVTEGPQLISQEFSALKMGLVPNLLMTEINGA